MIGFTLPEIRRLLTKLVLRVTDAAEHTHQPAEPGVGRVLERPLRVGWLVEPGFCPVDPEVAATVQAAAEALQSTGVIVEPVRISAPEQNFVDFFRGYGALPAPVPPVPAHEHGATEFVETPRPVPDLHSELRPATAHAYPGPRMFSGWHPGCEPGRVLPVETGQLDFRATLRSAGPQEQRDSVSDVFGDKASKKLQEGRRDGIHREEDN
ncbi:hypothetical protein [Amycolatopsis sp. NBC_00438]|uniref:hypothetical protein n=1 Tax=Amycolatopsis sp. NBC_00438 TaxID=2903558 RepID=UPI002E1A859A